MMGEWRGHYNGFSLAKAGYFEQGDNAFTVNDLAVIDHRQRVIERHALHVNELVVVHG